MSSKEDEEGNYLGFVAGSMAGLVGDGFVHPVDTIRTRLQAQRTRQYEGMWDAVRKTWRTEGVGAFYKGFGAVAAMTMPAHALYFGAYEATKKVLQRERRDEDKSAWVYFMSGFVADAFGSLIWTPMDVIKQRTQVSSLEASSQSGKMGERSAEDGKDRVKRGEKISEGNSSRLKPQSAPQQPYHHANSWRAAKSIVASEGLIGLYRGFPVALATFGPYVGLYFMFYEELKKESVKLRRRMTEGGAGRDGGNKEVESGLAATVSKNESIESKTRRGSDVSEIELPWNLACAFAAASLAALITCPIDVVKTNMQVYSTKEGGYNTTWETIKALYKTGTGASNGPASSTASFSTSPSSPSPHLPHMSRGLLAFFRGWNARILWLAPGSAITMAVYEQCKTAVTFIGL